MKANYLFVLFAAVVFVSSCKNQEVKPAAPTTVSSNIVGKWSIVKDSTFTQFIGSPTISVYLGTANDYYDFRSDGKCYISENGVNTEVSYQIASANTVVFGDPVAYIDASTGKTMYAEPEPTVIDPLTAHSAQIIFSYASPGGPHNTTVCLAR